ncbi:MAG: 2-amino-4-hydroxy-6-hydroxymethyldihydropteridine diphosphokinase [Candidatus Binatia bacterium]
MTARPRGGLTRVAIALGSNLGDRRAHLSWAVRALRTQVRDLVVSPFESTAPVDVPGPQPEYLNAVAVGRTALPPDALLEWLLALETMRGRVRTGPRSARTLDLDLILYGALVRRTPALMLPHPRFRDRAFVLGPLARLAPRWRDPERGETLARLWRSRGLPGRGKAARARA